MTVPQAQDAPAKFSSPNHSPGEARGVRAGVGEVDARDGMGEVSSARLTTDRTSPAITCEKCGSDDVLVRWHEKRTYSAACDYNALRRGPSSKREHLHYHCRCCQFDWIGPVLGGKL